MAIQKITIEDAEYPKNLKNIHVPPAQLYVNGDLLPQDVHAVALVGSRRASVYGIEACETLAFELAMRGVTVVSGMARGIDSAAHRGALKAKGRTIAVMGSGHGYIYPPENKDLYARIAESGAVVTEYADDTPPLREYFPQRNRIISGLSLGVVIVEAARKSGALITANFALEQGREVFAVPGKISSTTSAGTHDLIKDGARLVQGAEDILDELRLVELERPAGIDARDAQQQATGASLYRALSEIEKKVYEALSDEPRYVDDIAKETCVDAKRLSHILLNLELKKVIRQLPGKQYIRSERG